MSEDWHLTIGDAVLPARCRIGDCVAAAIRHRGSTSSRTMSKRGFLNQMTAQVAAPAVAALEPGVKTAGPRVSPKK